LGIASIAFSGIILLQFIVNVDFGIDTFFLKTDVSLNTSAPGRMSPNSSICFIACGFGLILLSFKQVPKLMYYLTLVLGIGVLVLASTSLLGYAADLSATYEWARLTPMALHTAIGFIIASGGIIAFVYSKDSLEEINLSSKSPYLAAVFVCCLTSLLWRASLQQGIERLNDLVSLKSGKIKELVTQIIDERVSDMEELKLHLDESPEISERLWVRSVDFYRNKSPFFKTIEWVDPYYNVQGFAPLKGNENILKRELLNHPFLQKDLEIAKSEGSVRISNVFQLKSGERALYIALPIFKGKMFRGYIIASTDVDVMLREVLNKVQLSKFEVAFFEGKEPKKSFFKSSSEVFKHISSVKEIPIYNSHWAVKVWPSSELFNKYESTLLSKLIVIAGFLLALFLLSSIRTRQIINKQALMLQQTKNTLKVQLLESSRHAKELRLLKEMTDAIQVCPSLKDANTPISGYCELLLPGTSGILYLSDDSEKTVTPFASWGTTSPKTHLFPFSYCAALEKGLPSYLSGEGYGEGCRHVEKSYVKSPQSVDLCLPVVDQGNILGLLSIHDYNKLSPTDADHKKTVLFLETLVNQLSLSISGIKMRDLLKEQATRDPLTNLFNRRYLEDILQRELHRAQRHGTPVSIIMIDIDHFKYINDTYGHDGGDEALAEIGLLLQKYYRKSDVACRFGGEEFILVLPEMSLKIAVQRAEIIRDSVQSLRLILRGQEMKGLTISLGVATYPQHGTSMQTLISAADKALYRAKNLGRNRVEVAQKDPSTPTIPSLEAV
jgi:diguanylate cyclase (GGDEF)-like protein